jgi:predicted nucleic acid-binding protein
VARYVIDAPTLLHLVENQLGIDPSHQLLAPSSVRSEALGLLLRQVCDGRLGDKEALKAHVRLTEVKMRLLGDRVSRATAWQIARAEGWESLRDAEYLAITRLQGDALVTIDPAFRELAARLVPVEKLEALLKAGS